MVPGTQSCQDQYISWRNWLVTGTLWRVPLAFLSIPKGLMIWNASSRVAVPICWLVSWVENLLFYLFTIYYYLFLSFLLLYFLFLLVAFVVDPFWFLSLLMLMCILFIAYLCFCCCTRSLHRVWVLRKSLLQHPLSCLSRKCVIPLNIFCRA